MELYISSQTQTVHATATCSVTRRNLARNLKLGRPLSADDKTCKRCDSDKVEAK